VVTTTRRKKKGKHHSLCEIVRFHFETKRDVENHTNFYKIVKIEQNFSLDNISNVTHLPIEGECDDAGIRYAQNKRYGVMVEVKSFDRPKHYKKACLQLAKDKQYFKKAYKLDRVFCIYAYGNKHDKFGVDITYKWIPESIIDNIKIK
jgi:hypothetical protein